MSPSKIVIIRHAEKPGDDKDPHISHEGWKRAWSIADNVQLFGPPDRIIASAASLKSNRPVETVAPLAAARKLHIDATVPDDDIEQLCEKLRSFLAKEDERASLVCWHHEKIPEIARQLGAGSAPKRFEDVYNQIWVLTPDPDKGMHLEIGVMPF